MIVLRAVRFLCLLAAAGVAGAAAAQQPDAEKAYRASQDAIGRPLPDIVLRDRLDRPVRLADYRGRPLVVSFVYTGCFQACPVATQALAKAVRQARAALGEEAFQVVSIGFNQPFDSPEAMAAFARQNRVADPRWEFLSPDRKDVAALTAAFGFSFEATPKGFDHITQATIVDPSGVIYRQVYGETFDLPLFVGPLKALRSGQAAEAVTLENVWEKVKLYCTVYDPNTGGYRVNYSLFFELFAGLTTFAGLGWFVYKSRRPAA
ncbi:MAG: SCO family protein [Burkholderiales bacterium]